MCRRLIVWFWEVGLSEDTDPQGWEERVTRLHGEFSILVSEESSSFFRLQDMLQTSPREHDL
eukprot:2954615-Prorocentrum_lima.AAC.1